MQRMGQSAMIPVNPFDARARPNPYPVYQYMRTVEPVHRSPVGFWILTRYDDCVAVLEDPRWSHEADRLLEPQRKPADPVDPLVRLIRASIAFSDPPAHTRHSRAIERAIAPAIATASGTASKTAEALVDLMVERGGTADLMSAFAAPFPLSVLGEVVGVPTSDLRQVHQWGRELARGLDPAVESVGVLSAAAASMGMVEYLQNSLDAARTGKASGLIASLGGARTKLSTWELIADLCMVLVTGVEASCALIGNAMLALLSNPDQLKLLRDEPALIDSAVEELLRFDGPIHLTARVATEDISIGNATIARGEQAIVLLGAANRDPERFRDPDRLDIRRADNPHLAFGGGAHACFASALGRTMAKVALQVLLGRLREINLGGNPVWNPTVTLRSLKTLTIGFVA